jgi:hypothetical protein
VHGTLGLRNIGRYRLRETGDAACPWVARHYADENGGDWRDLDFGQLLGNAGFLMTEAAFGN